MARRRELSAAKNRMSGGETRISWLLVLAAILFVVSRLYILFVLKPQITDVENTYFAYAIRRTMRILPPIRMSCRWNIRRWPGG